MIIINDIEKKLSIVHERINNDEERGYLIAAILCAIKWNSISDEGAKYSRGRIDGTNVYILSMLLERVMESKDYNNDVFTISFNSHHSPKEQKEILIKAITASFRWKGICLNQGEDISGDGDNLIELAVLLEQMLEVKEIK